jgi:UDP-glucose 4-epimerase
MKAFVTGGAGFIASHIIDAVLAKPGNEVMVYDNLSSGRTAYVEGLLEDRRCRFIRGDLLDTESVKRAISGQGIDIVFHLAANPDIARGAVDPGVDFRQSAVATFNLLEAVRTAHVPTLVFASGSGVYGDQGTTTTPETFGPLLPISMYGAGKVAAEAMISCYVHMYGTTAYILRFANVVGPRQTHGVVFDFIRKLRSNPRCLEILGDGEQSKSYIHVSDVVDAIFFVLEKGHERVNLYNVATDDYVKVNWIAEQVVRAMGLPDVEFCHVGGKRGWKGDVPVVRFDLDKIHSLGWKAKLSSGSAVERSILELLEEV